MSGSTENTANASEKPERREAFITLITAKRMLPLVQHIVEDVLRYQRSLAQLQPEQERLDRQKRTLAWPERQRRYQIRDDVAAGELHLQAALQELQALGMALLDPDIGRIGFPTIVNDRRAFFSWRPGEDSVRSWHFAEENVNRPIPSAWLKAGEASFTGKS